MSSHEEILFEEVHDEQASMQLDDQSQYVHLVANEEELPPHAGPKLACTLRVFANRRVHPQPTGTRRQSRRRTKGRQARREQVANTGRARGGGTTRSPPGRTIQLLGMHVDLHWQTNHSTIWHSCRSPWQTHRKTNKTKAKQNPHMPQPCGELHVSSPRL